MGNKHVSSYKKLSTHPVQIAKNEDSGYEYRKLIIIPVLVVSLALIYAHSCQLNDFLPGGKDLLSREDLKKTSNVSEEENTLSRMEKNVEENKPLQKADEENNYEKNKPLQKTEKDNEEKKSISKVKPDAFLHNASFQTNLSTKKIFFEGRRIAPLHLLPEKNVSSDNQVRVFLFDDFLSAAECDGLRGVHDKHIKMHSQKPPLLCFESLETLILNLKSVKKQHVQVSSRDFIKDTKCLNESFSVQVADWLNSNWSYSTAFYPGESPFSEKMAALIQETTGLKKGNGGKFQITSYPLHIGYKKHTDCTEGQVDKRDRMATVLVYLNDVEEGGETSFPELGIWAKPRKGRALVWNNMTPDGKCDPLSIHQANKVISGHKYILQRWYYYESFWSLGKRPTPPGLPKRSDEQAMVSCDEYQHGSCRWYDEWSYDVLTDYMKKKSTLV